MNDFTITSIEPLSADVAVVSFAFEGPPRAVKHPQGFALACTSTSYRARALVGTKGVVHLDGDVPPNEGWRAAIALRVKQSKHALGGNR